MAGAAVRCAAGGQAAVAPAAAAPGAVAVGGAGRQTLRLPCFHLKTNQLILPAFGAFTGTHALDPEPGDRFFALTGDAVVPLEAAISGTPTKSSKS